MRQLRLLASNSLIAFISISFLSDEVVRVTTDRSGPTGNVPLHENRDWPAENPSVGCAARRCTGTITKRPFKFIPGQAIGLQEKWVKTTKRW